MNTDIKIVYSKIYARHNDTMPVLVVRLPDNIKHCEWIGNIVLNGDIDCIFGEDQRIKMQVKDDNGSTYIDSFPTGSKVESYVPF